MSHQHPLLLIPAEAARITGRELQVPQAHTATWDNLQAQSGIGREEPADLAGLRDRLAALNGDRFWDSEWNAPGVPEENKSYQILWTARYLEELSLSNPRADLGQEKKALTVVFTEYASGLAEQAVNSYIFCAHQAQIIFAISRVLQNYSCLGPEDFRELFSALEKVDVESDTPSSHQRSNAVKFACDLLGISGFEDTETFQNVLIGSSAALSLQKILVRGATDFLKSHCVMDGNDENYSFGQSSESGIQMLCALSSIFANDWDGISVFIGKHGETLQKFLKSTFEAEIPSLSVEIDQIREYGRVRSTFRSHSPKVLSAYGELAKFLPGSMQDNLSVQAREIIGNWFEKHIDITDGQSLHGLPAALQLGIPIDLESASRIILTRMENMELEPWGREALLETGILLMNSGANFNTDAVRNFATKMIEEGGVYGKTLDLLLDSSLFSAEELISLFPLFQHSAQTQVTRWLLAQDIGLAERLLHFDLAIQSLPLVLAKIKESKDPQTAERIANLFSRQLGQLSAAW